MYICIFIYFTYIKIISRHHHRHPQRPPEPLAIVRVGPAGAWFGTLGLGAWAYGSAARGRGPRSPALSEPPPPARRASQIVSVSNSKGERAGAYLIGGSNWDQLSNATWLFDAYLSR